MAVSKVVYGGNTLIDLTGDTVAADKLLSGYTTHDAAGNAITGTATAGGGGLPAEIVAGDTPVICNAGAYQGTGTSLTDTGLSITISIAGTYRIKWIMAGGGGSSNYSIKSQIYKNGTAQGSTITTTSTQACNIDLACAAGDVITLYFAGYSYWGTISGGCGGLCACIDWDNGF